MRTISNNIFSIILFSFLLLFNKEMKSQSNSLLNSDHIPIMAYGWHADNFKTYDYNKIKELGLDGVMLTLVEQTMFDKFTGINDQVKLIPYQTYYYIDPNYIAQYTAATYTKWEAKDITTNSLIKAALQFNTNIGQRTNETPNCIKTKTALPGRLISGPGYRQRIRYPGNGSIITYKAGFRIMLKPGVIPPSSGETVCTLKVMFKELVKQGSTYSINDSTTIENVITVGKIGFNQWKTFDIDYNITNINTKYLYSVSGSTKPEAVTEPAFARYVEFIVDWGGLTNATLYFDNVTVSDLRGRDLTGVDATIRNQITNMANNIYNGGNTWQENTTNFASTVAGWYANDEPETIDNLEPVRIVGELIRNATNGQRPLFVSFSMPWNGLWDESGFGTEAINKAQEFYHRALPDGFIMQSHIFKIDNTEDEKIQIARYIINLQSLQSTAPIYSVLVQAGKWSPEVEVIPGPDRFRYSINLALLYGAKGIFSDQLFTVNDDVTGIIDATKSPVVYSDLYYEIKNTIAPRLRGTFGKTLKILNRQSQYKITAGATLSSGFLTKIETSPASSSDLDLGYFQDPNDVSKKYFMVVNRYYNSQTGLNYTFNSLTGYNNWEITNLVNNTKATITASSGSAVYNGNNIPLGDAGLYSVLPVVKYGGSLTTSESISGTNTLNGEMTILSGATLTVSGTYNVYKNITVNSGGTLTVNAGANLVFYNGALLIVNGAFTAIGAAANKITFTGQTKGSWGGIRFNSTSSANNRLYYCTIRNAVTGIYVESSSPRLEYSFIDDAAVYGIYITGSSALPLVDNNYIEADTACVAHYNGGNGYFASNSFRNAKYGVYISSGSPRYDYYNSGRNKFESTITTDRVYIAAGQPWFGMYQYFTVPNSTTYNYIRNNSVSSVSATYNYWSANPPLPIYFIGSGSVDRLYSLAAPPTNPTAGPGWTLAKTGDDFLAAFNEASILFYDGKYDEARNSFLKLTEKYLDSEYSSYSLNWYMLASEQLKETNKQDEYLKSIRLNKSAHENTKFYALKWLLQLEMRTGTVQKARTLSAAIQTRSLYDRELSLDLASGIYEYQGDKGNALEVLDRLSERFTDKYTLQDIEFIRNHINNNISSNKKIGNSLSNISTTIPEEYKLLGNYPNPFNPSTTISYTLPYQSAIQLTIYDIMGRKVKSFQVIQSPGTQNIIWDGTNLNGENVSSGIYIYRLKSKSLENNEVFEKSAKLMMMK